MTLWDLILDVLTGRNNKVKSVKEVERYEIFTYRTEDGETYFKFSFHLVEPFGYQIDIHKQPDYNGRNATSLHTHWIFSPRDADRMVCVKQEFYPKTLEAAKNLAMAWAELTWEYIKTNVSIDMQIELQHQNK